MTSNDNNDDIALESINDLTPELASKLLQRNYLKKDKQIKHKILVESISTHRVDQGVLSQVYQVTVNYEQTTHTDNNDFNKMGSVVPLSSKWIVKLKRPDLNLEWMFQCEQAFYREVVPIIFDNNDKTLSFPFSLAKLLSATGNHLILEYVSDCTCHDLYHGCPPNKIKFLLTAMAAWHAKCWNCKTIATIPHLIDPPGMGQRLRPLQKEYMFTSKWESTIKHMDLCNSDDVALHEFAIQLCQRMSTKRLRDIHDKVHGKKWTCVHGDWHIANWLFPREDKPSFRKPVLVDWATCGYGNPMIDLVFFLVVSTNDEMVVNVHDNLHLYHTSLLYYNDQISMELSQLQECFQWALLCQWMILVAYDELCRRIATTEPNDDKRKLQLGHFRNVNRRALLALHAFGNWSILLDSIPAITTKERQEAKDYCRNAVLQI